jgi:hypothetical protein
MLAEATMWLALARITIVLLPFPRIAARLGKHMHESAQGDDESRRAVLRRIAWAVGAIGRRAPWRCMCLERAIAARMMLRRRRIGSTLYFGVARDPATTAVQAHAWLRCGSYFVTGGEDRARYAVVSTFAEESLE